MGLVAKSYMTNGLRLNFLIYEENLVFFFISELTFCKFPFI
jgi:hypothetical protein